MIACFLRHAWRKPLRFLLMLLLTIPLMALVPKVAGTPGMTVLHVYGPGGPAPAMKEAAQAFSAKRQVDVEVTAGPTPTWKEQAMKDADLIFSGSEYMMTDFVQKDLPGILKAEDVQTLYSAPPRSWCGLEIRRKSKESATSSSRTCVCWWSKAQATRSMGGCGRAHRGCGPGAGFPKADSPPRRQQRGGPKKLGFQPHPGCMADLEYLAEGKPGVGGRDPDRTRDDGLPLMRGSGDHPDPRARFGRGIPDLPGIGGGQIHFRQVGLDHRACLARSS